MIPGKGLRLATCALLVAIWGTTWAAIRIGLGGIPPLTGVALRFGLAGLLLWGLAFALGLRGPKLLAPPLVWIVHGLLSFGVSYGLVYWAEQTLPTGLTAVLFATFPLWVAGLAHVFLPGERLGWVGVVGLFLGLAGVATIFSGDPDALGRPGVDPARTAFVAALTLLAPLASAVAQLVVKQRGRHVHSVPLNAGAMLLAAGSMGVLAAIFERDRPPTFDAASVGSLLYLALLGTAVTFSLYFWLLRHMASTSLSLTAFAIPVVAVAVGAAVFDEKVTWRVLAGGALVLVGTLLASSHRAKLRSEVAQP